VPVVNLHIRRDWQKWLVPTESNRRITAVCGVKTSEKYAGIPGVTDQPAFYGSDGNAGWCIHCCGLALEMFNRIFTNHNTSGIIKNQYVASTAVMSRQILMANGVE
jgi:hypothetical protein